MAPFMSKPVAGASGTAARAAAIRAIVSRLTSLYLRNRSRISAAIIISVIVGLANRIRQFIAGQKAAAAREKAERIQGKPASAGNAADEEGKKKKRRAEMDREFLRSLLRLLRIVIPGWRTHEMRLLISHGFFLVVRTLFSLQVAAMDGAIVKALVKGNGREFLRRIFWWMAISVPATYTNSMLHYHQSELALAFRTRLTQHMQEKYLSGLTYYSLFALDDRIKDPDQVIAVDVTKFSDTLADLYSNTAKPALDIIVYTISLARSVGVEGVTFMAFLLQLSSSVMRALTPPFGKYVAEEQRLEGEFRAQHTRLINHNEEVAMYAGHEIEKDTLDKGYFTLIKHVNRILRRRLYHGIMEDFILKYVWGALGLVLCSGPVFFTPPGRAPLSIGDRTQSLVTNRRILQNGSDAIMRIMGSYKDFLQLAGYTSRVSSFLDVMDQVQAGHYDKHLVSSTTDSKESNAAVLRGRGTSLESPDIEFINVPIVSPNGDVLVPRLSFTLKQGQHLLVIGPNGCGKSSMFRILGGLWPVYGGTVRRPPPQDIFYIPQRPYLIRGTLRHQVIYPDSRDRMAARGVTDDDLTAILRVLELEYLLEQYDGGWDAEAEWREALSMGLQQRVAMARLFYHRPRFAILDECTSSATLEAEKLMYDHAKKLGVSLMTVSHRRSLWHYHTHILQFDGQGGAVFAELDADRRMALEDEKEELERRLRSVPEMENRLRELSEA